MPLMTSLMSPLKTHVHSTTTQSLTRIRLKSAFSFGGSVFGEDEDVPEPPPDEPADCDGILEAFLTHVSIEKCRNFTAFIERPLRQPVTTVTLAVLSGAGWQRLPPLFLTPLEVWVMDSSIPPLRHGRCFAFPQIWGWKRSQISVINVGAPVENNCLFEEYNCLCWSEREQSDTF